MKLIKILALCFFVFTAAFAYVWQVPDSVATIQAAIDTAVSGDTVLVKNVHQNIGSVEIVGKRIALLSKGYLNNASTYNIKTGAALFDSLNTRPLLRIVNSDSCIVSGFLLDRSDIGNGGGVEILHSQHVLFDGVHFSANVLSVDSASLMLNNTEFYNMDSSDIVLIEINYSNVDINRSSWKNSNVRTMISTGAGSEITVSNLAVYNNLCSGEIYNIGSSLADFSFITSYNNNVAGATWAFSSTWVMIRNSILEYAPPEDISQCEVSYSAVPGHYPGTGNISLNPCIDSTSTIPVLMDISPCISAANPDTANIPRTDINGNPRPDPEWAPPDMGAYESSRHMLLNDDHHFWVDPDGDDVWGNGSAAYPFESIQAAVDYATPTDTVLIRAGNYYGRIEVDGKSLTIASPFLLAGDSSYVDSVILMPEAGQSTPVFLFRDIDSLTLAGITIQNGKGREFYSNYSFGGAIYCEGSDLRLNHMALNNNTADYAGGAIYALNSDLLLNDVSLTENNAYFGGALALSNSTGHLAHVDIHDNIASSGGGIHIDNGSDLVAYYLTLSDNYALNDSLESQLLKPVSISQYGGAIFSDNAKCRLHNTRIDNNTAANKGGAIFLRYGELYVVQSTLADNSVLADLSATVTITDPIENVIVLNSVLSDPGEKEFEITNTGLNLVSSLVTGGVNNILLQGDGNETDSQDLLDADPLFNADYGLSAGSPGYDKGLSSYSLGDYYLIHYDASQYSGLAPDLGYSGSVPDIYFELESIESGLTEYPQTFDLLCAYPNPFNPVTTLDFTLSQTGNAAIRIFDLSGREVATPLHKHVEPGRYHIRFMPSGLSSGIYIARLSLDDRILSTTKLLLVK